MNVLACRLIRLTSPNLNYVILAGAALLYVDIFFVTLPRDNEKFATISCHVNLPLLNTAADIVVTSLQITVLLTSFGYSLCFGTIMAKMMRIYYIFNNPLNQKSSVLVGTLHCGMIFINSLHAVCEGSAIVYICVLPGWSGCFAACDLLGSRQKRPQCLLENEC